MLQFFRDAARHAPSVKRRRASAILAIFFGFSQLVGSVFATPPAPTKNMTQATYQIDEAKVQKVVYDAFFATLHAQSAGQTFQDKDGGVYVVEEQKSPEGTRYILRRTSALAKKPGAKKALYLIDGQEVSSAVYGAFRKSLKEVPGTWYCAEMSDGGATGMDGTASDGARYKIHEQSTERGGDRMIITRQDLEIH